MKASLQTVGHSDRLYSIFFDGKEENELWGFRDSTTLKEDFQAIVRAIDRSKLFISKANEWIKQRRKTYWGFLFPHKRKDCRCSLLYYYVNCLRMSSGYRHPSGVPILGFSLRNRRGRTLRPRRKGSWEARWSKEERSRSAFSPEVHLHSPTSTVLPSSDSETTSSSIVLLRPTVPHQRFAGRKVMPSIVINGTACRQRCSHMFAT